MHGLLSTRYGDSTREPDLTEACYDGNIAKLTHSGRTLRLSARSVLACFGRGDAAGLTARQEVTSLSAW